MTGSRTGRTAQRGTRATVTPYEPTPEHLKDLKTLSEAFAAEADERGWCDEYREFVENVNQLLTVKLELPVQEYTINIQGESYTGSSWSGLDDDLHDEVTIDATSEEEAVEKVAEIVNKYLRGELVEKS